MSDPTIKIDVLDINPFLDGPCEFLAKTVCAKILEVPQFQKLFGDFVDPYMRTDYPLNSLPALRVYERGYTKEADSGWINGDLYIDVIWPPALRRVENQQAPGTVASALLQQFRRNTFFNVVEQGEPSDEQRKVGYNLLGVPGLNQLGKRFAVDKSLGFQLSENEIAPLTQIRLNFRVDLRIWDDYLEDQLRTKDDPFEQTLGELNKIVGRVVALREGSSDEQAFVELEQSPNEDPEEL